MQHLGWKDLVLCLSLILSLFLGSFICISWNSIEATLFIFIPACCVAPLLRYAVGCYCQQSSIKPKLTQVTHHNHIPTEYGFFPEKLHLFFTAASLITSLALGDVLLPPVYRMTTLRLVEPREHLSTVSQLCCGMIGPTTYIVSAFLFSLFYMIIKWCFPDNLFYGTVLPPALSAVVHFHILMFALSLIPLPQFDGWDIFSVFFPKSWVKRVNLFIQRHFTFVYAFSLLSTAVFFFFIKTLQKLTFDVTQHLMPADSLRLGLFFFESIRRIIAHSLRSITSF